MGQEQNPQARASFPGDCYTGRRDPFGEFGAKMIYQSDSVGDIYDLITKPIDQSIYGLPRASLFTAHAMNHRFPDTGTQLVQFGTNEIQCTPYWKAAGCQQTTDLFPVERREQGPTQAVDVSDPLDQKRLGVLGSEGLETIGQVTKSKLRRCSACKVIRKKCIPLAESNDPRCAHCYKLQLPFSLCTRQAITQHEPFTKWINKEYEILFTEVQHRGNIQLPAQFQHYDDGPSLQVICCDFTPTLKHQTRALKKDSSGWHSMHTTAFCLEDGNFEITPYVHQCIPHVLNEVCESESRVSVFFRVARVYQDHPLIKDCLGLFTCLRLLLIGWQVHGPETLGMATVHDPQSPWNGRTPVPRMIQNQLGHLLELEMIALDKRILEALHRMLDCRNRSSWIFATLAFFILLHVRELDAGRNIYWGRYKDSGGFWIHPSKPNSLIEEELASCSALLSNYHAVIGKTPMTLNWDCPASRILLDNDEMSITSMKVLQSYIHTLRSQDLIGQRASAKYKDGKPKTVEWTISSKLFEDVQSGTDLSGFIW